MLRVREQGWIGVDIGTHTVKLAQVERKGNAYALTEAVVIQRAEPWHDDGTGVYGVRESDEELIAARTLGESFQGRRAASLLPMAVCQLKSMHVPDGPGPQRRAFVAKELAARPMQSGGPREFDFWPIDNTLENATIVRENVSVLSVARAWTLRLARDHERARLVCETLDGAPLALGRAVQMMGDADPARPVAVLDWGFTRATFCVVLQGRPLFVRCLRGCEYGVVIRALRHTLALTWDEARRLAMDFAAGLSAGPTQDASLQAIVTEVAEPAIGQLVAELQRTMVYLQMHRSRLVPQQMWLFGGGATVRGIASLLKQRVGLDAGCWNLGGDTFHSGSAGTMPVALLGPAVALSALAWEEA